MCSWDFFNFVSDDSQTDQKLTFIIMDLSVSPYILYVKTCGHQVASTWYLKTLNNEGMDNGYPTVILKEGSK